MKEISDYFFATQKELPQYAIVPSSLMKEIDLKILALKESRFLTL